MKLYRYAYLGVKLDIRGAPQRVKELMVTLRRAGYSSGDISRFSGDRWDEGNIRTYTLEWGGIDGTLNAERVNVMSVFRDFVNSGLSLDDVEAVLRLDTAVKAKKSTLLEVAELVAALRPYDLKPGAVGKIIDLVGQLKGDGTDPLMIDDVRWWIHRDKELEEEGFDRLARLRLKTAFTKFGGASDTLEAVDAVIEKQVLDKELSQLKTNVADLKVLNDFQNAQIMQQQIEKLKIETDNENLKKEYTITNKLIALGHDEQSLAATLQATRTFGNAAKVLSAINKQGPIINLEGEKAKLSKQASEIKLELNAYQYQLAEAIRVYNENSDVRRVIHLLENPQGINMEPLDAFNLLVKTLKAAANVTQAHLKTPIHDQSWEVVKECIQESAEKMNTAARALEGHIPENQSNP